jgi:hypothetical protein
MLMRLRGNPGTIAQVKCPESRQLAVPFLDDAVRSVGAFVPLDPAQPKRERGKAVQNRLEKIGQLGSHGRIWARQRDGSHPSRLGIQIVGTQIAVKHRAVLNLSPGEASAADAKWTNLEAHSRRPILYESTVYRRRYTGSINSGLSFFELLTSGLTG